MGENIIKVRDDHSPVEFIKVDSDDSNEYRFKQQGEKKAAWINNENFGEQDLRNRIEPWLTSLFQSEHLSLLIGSGLTSAIQIASAGMADNGMGEFQPKSKYADKIIAKAFKEVKKTGRGDKPNIEDYLRVMNELLPALEILDQKDAYIELKNEIETCLSSFTSNISEIEYSIASADYDKRTEAFNRLVSFLMSFASRTGTRDRLNIFTTNYDRMIEAGADLAGLRLVDRFVGSLSPVFRSSRMDIDMHYNPPGIRGEPRYLEGVVKYTKLHGSIDWIDTNEAIKRIGIPFGARSIEPFLSCAGISSDASRIMIYPNAAKDRETAEYPYVELFRDFAAALCRPNSTLVVYGYSFGDDHINRVIKDMLTIPATHLVIIAFNDPSKRIMNIYEQWGRKNQMTLIIGEDIANLNALTDYYLPKPAIDKTTIRMAELLRQRYDMSETASEKE